MGRQLCKIIKMLYMTCGVELAVERPKRRMSVRRGLSLPTNITKRQ